MKKALKVFFIREIRSEKGLQNDKRDLIS